MRILFWLILSVTWIVLLARSWGPVPALGPLLEVHGGVWRHQPFRWQDHAVKGLQAKVDVAIDQNGVPHVFASNLHDLYLAQGYIVASQRLFQIDVSTRSMSGHLSELVGTKGNKLDVFFTKFGMPQAEVALHDAIMADPEVKKMGEAFVAGINQQIAQLTDLPVEYKLLGKTPQPMTTHILSRMAKAMTYSLSASNPDVTLSHLRQSMPVAKILDLFPEFLPADYEDFVYPGLGGKIPRAKETADLFKFQSHFKNFPDIPRSPLGNGSNNWVVGPKKSVTGHSILANDTHLGLSLPNVWYEIQLSSPEFNVYGVSFPAVPGIVNGFNQDIAWGPTNGATDAIDYYEVEFSDESSLKYKDGEEWLEAKLNTETAAGETLQVPWTKWGPVLYREGRDGLVVNWTGYRTTNELGVLRRLYTAKTARECLDVFSSWQVPIQNFVCADKDHFGMRHAGWIAERKIGEGRFINSPELTANQLTKQIPTADQPQAYDPPQGFLRSANQRIEGPNYPHYMGWSYEEPFRGMSIRRRLEAKEKLSGQDFIDIQNDNYSIEAEMILPILLKELTRTSLTSEQAARVQELETWDHHMRAKEVAPSIYREWFIRLKNEIFSDDIALSEKMEFAPKDARIAWMLKRVTTDPNDSDSFWIDNQKTPVRETLADVVTAAYLKAWSSLSKDLGADSSAWTWRRSIKTQLAHIARIPGFGSPVLDMDGSFDSVRGNRGGHGAVYRFVIELGDRVRAWMQVPGGNSGDPFSPDFERFTKEWARGEMHEVEFYSTLAEAKGKAVQIIELSPGEKE